NRINCRSDISRSTFEIFDAVSKASHQFTVNLSLFQHLIQFLRKHSLSILRLLVFFPCLSAGKLRIYQSPIKFFVNRVESRKTKDERLCSESNDKHDTCSRPVHQFEECSHDNNRCSHTVSEIHSLFAQNCHNSNF